MKNEFKKSASQSTMDYPFDFYHVDEPELTKDREKMVNPAPSDYYAKAEQSTKKSQHMLKKCPDCFYRYAQ